MIEADLSVPAQVEISPFERPRAVYQLHVRPWLGELARTRGRPCTLVDLPEALLEDLERMGFGAVWLVGVWEASPASRRVTLDDATLMRAMRHYVPDLSEVDVVGSPFAPRSWRVDPALGGEEALTALRARMAARGLKLILDLVINHTARDAAPVTLEPQLYVHASPDAAPEEDAFKIKRVGPPLCIAYGRDPWFPGWTDTAQLDLRSRATRDRLLLMIKDVLPLCDAIQFDMAMLALSAEFNSTWDGKAWEAPADLATGEIWAELTRALRALKPDLWLIAEVYWGREWDIQELGFDHTYDKTLFDRLRDGDARSIREHLTGRLAYQVRCLRFIEHHYQQRAATAFPPGRHQAAAVLFGTAPGIHMFQDGQLEGRRMPAQIQVARRPREEGDRELTRFYERLLAAMAHPALRRGHWRLLPAEAGSRGDPTAVFVQRWRLDGAGTVVSVVNFSAEEVEARVILDDMGLDGREWTLRDLLSGERMREQGRRLLGQGMTLTLPPWAARIYAVER